MSAKSEHFDVIILGAGASGLLCAFTAAQRGRRVLVLERANKIGKKILMSGGGRCNFTNQLVEADNFISANPHFCKSALRRYTQWDFIELVERHGISYEERKHSQLFCKDSAKEIVAMLVAECEWAGVQIRTHCEINRIEAINTGTSRYRLGLQQADTVRTLACESLVVATGALSIPTLGGSGLGYEIARQFDLPLTERRAGLVPLMFSDAMKQLCERLSGLAVEVTIRCNGHSFTENMLFTHRGISGPAVLQISNYWYPGDDISIDLLPGINAPQWLVQSKQSSGKSRLRTVLGQHLAKGLIAELQQKWWPEHDDTALAEISDKQLIRIGEQLNGWCLKPSASEGYRTAEVTLGGVDTDAISSKTMEAKQQPGLFFIGEVLDVTGHLGGFNFQWAWSSGYSAGLAV
ncbi:NAD(P)/FAD-dependent oxidoreductase [Pseudomonas sp. gcc21]|uniref:NAD(P)/FAD-dependent oxidoreductase n=1 Tax=Pseudomonas sp. gcc21 TaxID=2726989 RepID=UPI001451651A|nr:NAD(P)/FAD-dependent oxidoreductase [Pseudomonas sp. gcc21]QJD59366.1 NAD(P)/FAD-dependent oxidoreductase [Pseudomonas sp. gcc21]